MTDWFAEESFWIDMYPVIFSEDRMQSAEEQTDKILKLVDFQKGPVLDLCCGPGRHSIALTKRGIEVTAVDRTPFLLNKAKSTAAELGLSIEFVQEDMRDFLRPQTYSFVLNMFTSFGYFEDKQDDFRVLRNVYENLKPGGSFLIDTIGKEIAAAKLHFRIPAEFPDGSLLIERPQVIDSWTRIRTEWILVRGETVKRFTFQHRLYSGQELRDILQSAGFQDVMLYGDLDGKEYGADAGRLIAVARKPVDKH